MPLLLLLFSNSVGIDVNCLLDVESKTVPIQKYTDRMKSIVAGNSQKRWRKRGWIGSGTTNVQTNGQQQHFGMLGFLFLIKLRSWPVNVLKNTSRKIRTKKKYRNETHQWNQQNDIGFDFWTQNKATSIEFCQHDANIKIHELEWISRKNCKNTFNVQNSTVYPISACIIAFIWHQFMGISIEFGFDSTILVTFCNIKAFYVFKWL